MGAAAEAQARLGREGQSKATTASGGYVLRITQGRAHMCPMDPYGGAGDYPTVLPVGVSLFAQSSLVVVATAGAPAPTEYAETVAVRGPSDGRPTEETQRAGTGAWESGWADWSFNTPTAPAKEADPRANGRRLLIASAILGGVALTLNTTRAAWFAVGCKKAGYHYDDGCFGTPIHQGLGTAFLGGPALALNLTGAGLAASGGYRRGSVGPQVPSVTATRHVAWGSVMVGLGVAVQITSALLVLSVFRVDSDEINDGNDADAFRRRYVGATFGAQAGATLTAAGGGLLTHGLGQRKRAADVDVAFSATGFSLRF